MDAAKNESAGRRSINQQQGRRHDGRREERVCRAALNQSTAGTAARWTTRRTSLPGGAQSINSRDGGTMDDAKNESAWRRSIDQQQRRRHDGRREERVCRAALNRSTAATAARWTPRRTSLPGGAQSINSSDGGTMDAAKNESAGRRSIDQQQRRRHDGRREERVCLAALNRSTAATAARWTPRRTSLPGGAQSINSSDGGTMDAAK